jgi:MYXO-CTERM domain-containing protein
MTSSEYARALTAGLLALMGCEQQTTDPVAVEGATEPIIGGITASAYPEAALLDISKNGSTVAGYCSGSVIAPKVVLTAGHCVIGFKAWKVTTPFADKQTATATEGALYDWTSTSETVTPKQHDVGLVFLPTAITLPSWPVVAQSPLADGAKLVNIGRIQDGKLSKTALYVSAPIAVQSASKVGYPYDYYSKDIIESGDSGGPDVAADSSPHKIVAVNSGGSDTQQVLARVDLVYTWIDEQVKAHGGWGDGGSDAGSGSVGSGGIGGGGTGGGGSGGGGGSTARRDAGSTTGRDGSTGFGGSAGPDGRTTADAGAASGGSTSADARAAGTGGTSGNVVAGAGGTNPTGVGGTAGAVATGGTQAGSGGVTSTGGSSSGGSNGSGGMGGTSQVSSQASGGQAGKSSSGSGHAGSSGVNATSAEPGCSCRVAGEPAPVQGSGMAVVGLIALGALLVRRRQSRS